MKGASRQELKVAGLRGNERAVALIVVACVRLSAVAHVGHDKCADDMVAVHWSLGVSASSRKSGPSPAL